MFSFSTKNVAASAGNAVHDFMTVFRTPRFIDVNDLRLGVSSRILQAVVVAYFAVLMISFKEYEVKYTPKGGAQYYMSSGSMYTEQESAYTDSMCADTEAGKYDYTDPDCSTGDLFWCEYNITCYSPMFGEASTKHDGSIWAYSYLKDHSSLRDDCSVITGQSYCDTALPGSTYYSIGAGDADSLCSCQIFDNKFYRGVEGMRFIVVPSYNIEELGFNESRVLTRVRGYGDSNTYGAHSSDFKVFDKDENVVLTIKDMIGLSGISNLDEPNYEAMSHYPSIVPGEIASFRQTGFEIILDFRWIGSLERNVFTGEVMDSDVELILTVNGRKGYSSKGNKVLYTTVPDSSRALWHDHYYRGVKLSLEYGGSVGTFRFFNLVVVITSLTILLSLSGFLVSMVAYYFLGYSSEVYDAYGRKRVSLHSLHAKLAAQALSSGLVWTGRAPNLAPDERLTFTQLADLFMTLDYNEHESKALAAAILRCSMRDVDETEEELTHMTDTLTKIVSRRRGSLSAIQMANLTEQFDDLKETSLSMAQFQELVSDDETSIEAIKRLAKTDLKKAIEETNKTLSPTGGSSGGSGSSRAASNSHLFTAPAVQVRDGSALERHESSDIESDDNENESGHV